MLQLNEFVITWWISYCYFWNSIIIYPINILKIRACIPRLPRLQRPSPVVDRLVAMQTRSAFLCKSRRVVLAASKHSDPAIRVKTAPVLVIKQEVVLIVLDHGRMLVEVAGTVRMLLDSVLFRRHKVLVVDYDMSTGWVHFVRSVSFRISSALATQVEVDGASKASWPSWWALYLLPNLLPIRTGWVVALVRAVVQLTRASVDRPVGRQVRQRHYCFIWDRVIVQVVLLSSPNWSALLSSVSSFSIHSFHSLSSRFTFLIFIYKI